MKRNLFVFFFLCITSLQLYAQELLWENAYGGNKKDWIHHAFQNWQGNYVFSGHSGSGISGDKTEESRGLTDSWIIETDPSGNILWQKTLGGNGFDKIIITLELKDGGYLLAGESNSGISGEKNQPAWNSRDLWLVKLDEKREIVWQQTYGGTIFENLSDIISTRDGGYILVAESNSPVSGDRTANSYGGADLWVLKLDNFGEIEWQRSYGGDNHDIGAKILESTKGYIIVGSSSSGISGNKTLESIGQSDYWLFEINSTGDILWQKVIGGNSADFIADFIPATGGGYILAGESSSGVSGNKDIPRKGFEDLWLVKTDDRGNIIWQNSYAGPGSQWMTAVAPSSDSGYLISAMSYSEIGNDKTETNRGERDFWMLKITEDGEVCWDKTLGGKSSDQPMGAFEDSDGNFVVAGWSDSGASGDKSEESLGDRDTWVIKISQPDITEPLVKIQDPITACDENGDGFTEFDLKYLEKQIIGGQENIRVSYFDKNWNPFASPLPDKFTNTVKDRQIINVRLTNTKIRCVETEFELVLEVGCDGTSKGELIFPEFITPNGDGYNDIWKVETTQPGLFKNVYIFDRFGKLLKLLPPDTGWDGKFNGQPMPSDDYWYIAILKDNDKVSGHFSLIR